MRIISIINLICMPFILTLFTFYHLFGALVNYFIIIQKQLYQEDTAHVKSELRFYNELQHEYDDDGIKTIEKYSSEYITLFKIKSLSLYLRLLIFLLSSILSVIVFLSIINDGAVNLIIFPNKPVCRLVGIAPLIALFRNYMN